MCSKVSCIPPLEVGGRLLSTTSISLPGMDSASRTALLVCIFHVFRSYTPVHISPSPLTPPARYSEQLDTCKILPRDAVARAEASPAGCSLAAREVTHNCCSFHGSLPASPSRVPLTIHQHTPPHPARKSSTNVLRPPPTRMYAIVLARARPLDDGFAPHAMYPGIVL